MLDTTITQAQQLVGGFNAWIAQALNGNSIIAGAATASIIGSLFFVLRHMPMRLWRYAKRFIFFTYQIEYNLTGGQTMIQVVAQKFEHELQKRISKRRATARLITRKKRIAESLSDGGFMFRYNGAWIWISRDQQKQAVAGGSGDQNTSAPKTSVTLSLSTLRVHREKILEILTESAKEYTVPGIYQMAAPSWSGGMPLCQRLRNFTSLAPLALDHQVREKVDAAIEKFLMHRDRKNKNDEPHKLVFMFHGEPGTGKSALGEYIAFKLKTSLFCINGISVEGHRSLHLSDALLGVRENIADHEVPVILCDDFDTFWSGLRKRTADQKEDLVKRGWDPEDNIVLGQMLASLQSPTELNDCVVIFTTNHLDKIDPAMYRPGRVTVLCEIGRMSPKSVMEYFEMVYGEQWPAHTPIEKALRACDISAFREANEDNPQGFVQAITSVEVAADEAFRSKADAVSA